MNFFIFPEFLSPLVLFSIYICLLFIQKFTVPVIDNSVKHKNSIIFKYLPKGYKNFDFLKKSSFSDLKFQEFQREKFPLFSMMK